MQPAAFVDNARQQPRGALQEEFIRQEQYMRRVLEQPQHLFADAPLSVFDMTPLAPLSNSQSSSSNTSTRVLALGSDGSPATSSVYSPEFNQQLPESNDAGLSDDLFASLVDDLRGSFVGSGSLEDMLKGGAQPADLLFHSAL